MNNLMIVIYHKCYSNLLYKFSQIRNVLTPKKIGITYNLEQHCMTGF